MQKPTLLMAVLLLAAGCDQTGAIGEQDRTAISTKPEKGTPRSAARAVDSDAQEARPKQPGGSRQGTEPWQKLNMHSFRDAQGHVIVEMPFPPDWKIASNPKRGEPTITGPNGIKVIDFPAQSFLNTSDPQMRQLYLQSGQRLRAMPSIEQLIHQDLAPWCAGQGLEYVRHYEVPEVTKIDKWYNDQLFKAVPTDTRVMAIGTEWKHKEGHPYFILMHIVCGTGGSLQTWYYYCSGLQAKTEHFETAKKQLLFGLANARYNLQEIAKYNQREAEKAGRSWAAHNERMARNQAAFEASQRAFVNNSSAANDALMRGWRERNAASDKGHERFIDTITERANVVDSSTGTRYKVESGSSHYWMNPNGEYIGTDNPNFNPNLTPALNEESWKPLENADR